MTIKIFNKEVNIPEKIFIIAAAYFPTAACANYLNMNTSNILTLVFLLGFYMILKRAFKISDKKVIKVSRILGFFFMLFFIMAKLSAIISSIHPFWNFITYIIGFFILSENILKLLYGRFLNVSFKRNGISEDISLKKKLKIFFGCVLTLFICWTPYFLRFFPGIISQDSATQLNQVLGGPYSDHHPFMHTMVIKLFYNLGTFIFGNNLNYGVAVYSVCQMFLLAAAFSYMIFTIYKHGAKKWTVIVILIFYAFIPYNGIYSVTMWKDIWFGGIMTMFSTTIYRLTEFYKSEGNNGKKIPVYEIIMFFIFGLCVCLFRSNGLYAFIVLIPFIIIVFRKKKNIIVSAAALAALITALIIKGPVYNYLNVEPPDIAESLSMPMQHISRAIHDGAYLTKEQYDLLSEVVDVEAMPRIYDSTSSDNIKYAIRKKDNQKYIIEHKWEYIKLWLEIGIKNPTAYILAQTEGTLGYWYPDVQHWVFKYNNYIIPEELNFKKDMKLPESIGNAMDSSLQWYKSIPVYGLIWSIGACTWTCMFFMGFCYLKRRKSFLLVYIPVFAVLFTLFIATPVYAEFRYAYSLFTTVPLLFAIPFINGGKSEKNNFLQDEKNADVSAE